MKSEFDAKKNTDKGYHTQPREDIQNSRKEEEEPTEGRKKQEKIPTKKKKQELRKRNTIKEKRK